MVKYWTEEEDQVLKQDFNKVGATELAKKMDGRSRSAITRRADLLGIYNPVKRGPNKRHCTALDINRVSRERWLKLKAEIPQDTRTPGQRLMGEPIFERSALFKKQMEAR